MQIKSTDLQNDVDMYLDILDEEEEIVITRYGVPVARLLSMDGAVKFLSDCLVGVLPPDADEKSIREEREDCP